MKIIATITLVGIALLLAAWGLGWVAVPGQVAGASNVRVQYAEAYKAHESLQAISANVCSARALVEASTSDNERIQRQTQAIAQEQNYQRVAAQYDARMADAFQAKYVKPSDLPEQAPPLPACAA